MTDNIVIKKGGGANLKEGGGGAKSYSIPKKKKIWEGHILRRGASPTPIRCWVAVYGPWSKAATNPTPPHPLPPKQSMCETIIY